MSVITLDVIKNLHLKDKKKDWQTQLIELKVFRKMFVQISEDGIHSIQFVSFCST